jgi:ferritin-like metal-binding protein YciE
MAPVADPQSLFNVQLAEMLYVERKLGDEILPALSNEVENGELKKGIEAHAQQSKEHAQSLERAFEILGAESKPQPSHALDGLRKDHDEVAKNIKMNQLRDVFDGESVAKSEHLEIAAYRGMIKMAKQMGQNEVRQILEQNCKQDEEMLKRLEGMSQQLNRELAGAAAS